MISVCIAAYNGAAYVEQQIKSILCQLSVTDELIITDDGSSDDTVKIIQSFRDHRIKLIRNDKRLGYSMNFSKAIGLAKGDYVFLSDQDDVWRHDKISQCVEALKTHEIVAHDAQIFYSNSGTHAEYYSQFVRPNISFFGNLVKIRFLGCCLAMRKSVASELFPLVGLKYLTHDGLICVVGSFFYSFKYISNPLIYYRRHDHNTSQGHQKNKNTLFVKLHIRLNFLLALFRIMILKLMR